MNSSIGRRSLYSVYQQDMPDRRRYIGNLLGFGTLWDAIGNFEESSPGENKYKWDLAVNNNDNNDNDSNPTMTTKHVTT